ncbi:follistatin-related protein 5-like [Hydractinia symbiolongicarpus]|uniref:follistatin-related protein 5-like n=1 Tax=Hydractinia symbiolongicarpus TaxID=13093 RepID=UPI002549ED46|nr:follistatin-related protein 5-like [Hydractinia symbiolongicarpus]
MNNLLRFILILVLSSLFVQGRHITRRNVILSDCKILNCPPSYIPICADDYRTYNNLCELQNAMCRTQQYIRVLSFEPCF